MFDQLQFSVDKQTESAAYALLKPSAGSVIRSLAGNLNGPHCQFARTLPADFALAETKSGLTVGQVIDPCYWTPALPFLYDMQLTMQMHDEREIEQSAKVGLRRWECSGKNFRLESRRFVLRGAGCDQLTEENAAQARAAETALLVDHYDQSSFGIADYVGVLLILDLRSMDDFHSEIISKLSWSPSLFLILVNADQLARQKEQFAQQNLVVHWPKNCHLAQCLSASSEPAEMSDFSTAALAVELEPGERPPNWLADIERPVVAIRRGVVNDDLQQARAACDRLQAELAPEFNLAGYFVAP